MVNISQRPVSAPSHSALVSNGLDTVLARIYAARGIESVSQLETELSRLTPYDHFKNVREMAALLADAIEEHKKILIIADYDADGATACAVGIRALREFGAIVDYLVPNRFEHGYGLTAEIVREAYENKNPDIIITVDNGIASVAGVAEANRLGIVVCITDHHLPGDELPKAKCIVNPSQPGCEFPSKYLAGVGVIFYVMIALRAELRERNSLSKETTNTADNLARLLDLVALGTVADVVNLDHNNRILVQQGLKRMRANLACCGISALFRVAARDIRRASAFDLGYAIGPRLNAAGRLQDMSLGIECLITDDENIANKIAKTLEDLNHRRREIQSDMQDSLAEIVDAIDASDSYSISLFDPSWHSGVIGILASRLKDRFHRPTIVFALGNEGEIKGSGRSISGLHMRDALDLISKKWPGLLRQFGGHAAAAGLTLQQNDFAEFSKAFEQTVRSLITPAELSRVIETDGPLAHDNMTLEFARRLQQDVWGQGFPQPQFCDDFVVDTQRIVGGKHLKLKLRKSERFFDAILFSETNALPRNICAVYRMEVNEFKNTTSLQLAVQHWQAN